MRMLVTGAAGLLGTEVTISLARAGHAVVAMVHRNRQLVHNDGNKIPAAEWDGRFPRDGQVALLNGDVCDEQLGMSGATPARLAAELDLIVHNAAITKFGREPRAYFEVNTAGTTRVLDFALRSGRQPIPVLHISTAYVCGEQDGVISESHVDKKPVFGNPYEESKFEAEVAAERARAAGLPIAIARPSVIVGHSRTGAIRDFENLYVMLRLITEGKVHSLPANYNATLNLAPIDYVAAAITSLVKDMDRAAGSVFHIVSNNSITLGDLSDVMAEYPPFYTPRFVPPYSFDPESLPQAERKYYDRVTRLYASYFRRNPRFECGNLTSLRPGVRSAGGKSLVRRLIDYGLRVGYFGRRTM